MRELDALGGEMGRAIDETFIQSRMLNTGKGPAVHSLRAQADKTRLSAAHAAARWKISRKSDASPGGSDARYWWSTARCTGVETATGARILCRAVILCCGRVSEKPHSSSATCSWHGRPAGAGGRQLAHGVAHRPGLFHPPVQNGHARARGRPHHRFFQHGAAAGRRAGYAVFLPDRTSRPQNKALCYLTYTTEETHEIIRENLHRAPMYNGHDRMARARATAPPSRTRSCASRTRTRHPAVSGAGGAAAPCEWYVQGMSTSLPEDVQM